MTVRASRELGLACLFTLLGGVAVLVAAQQRWLDPGSPGDPATGAQVVPVSRALALVALAGVVALLAARGWTRRVVGIVLALAGTGIVASAVGQLSAARTPLWPLLTVLGGLLVAVAGAGTVLRAGTWPALGARYDTPGQRRSAGDTPGQQRRSAGDASGQRRSAGDVWEALDRGEDPTRGDATAPPRAPSS